MGMLQEVTLGMTDGMVVLDIDNIIRMGTIIYTITRRSFTR